ncbi:hypothetical protein ACT691_16560 [Vibrio metschnikovii]
MKKLALARSRDLIDLAKENTQQGDNKLRFTHLMRMRSAKLPASLTLIEDEATFTASQNPTWV